MRRPRLTLAASLLLAASACGRSPLGELDFRGADSTPAIAGEDATTTTSGDATTATNDGATTTDATTPPKDGDGGLPVGRDAGPPRPDGGAGACAELAGCCARMSGMERAACEEAVASGRNGRCQRRLDEARASGVCAAPDGGSGLGPQCSDLLACCPNAPPPLQGFCTTTANGGDEARCGQALQLGGSLCGGPGADAGPPGVDAGRPGADGGPPGLGPECSALLACCAGAPQVLQGLCIQAASGANEGQCGQVLRLAGPLCSGTPGLGPECSALLACCPNVPGPLQQTCVSTANDADETRCRQSLRLAGSLCGP